VRGGADRRAATQDAEALITGDADCICYAANSTGREDQVVDDCVRMLAAGKNVVNVSDPALVYPKAKGGNVYDRLQQACLAGNASFYTSGGDPGWAGFGLALAPLTVAQQVRSIGRRAVSGARIQQLMAHRRSADSGG
jgi:hypothetical protein